jgi:hypothetical protein
MISSATSGIQKMMSGMGYTEGSFSNFYRKKV